MTTLLGLDIGTTGARCLAVDEKGNVRAAASADYPLYSPRPGWSEQRPEDWWEASCRVIAQVAGQVGGEISAIGLAGQMHGAVFLDQSDAVIRPALLWNDQRTAAQCAAITARIGAQRLIEIAGNPALTGFQAPKILWLLDEEPDAYARLTRVLLPKDYIRLRLTGEVATDASDASGTLLLSLRDRNWSDELLDALEIPRRWLPAVFEGPDQTGQVRDEVSRDLGLPAGLVVAAGGGDNAAAAVGNGVVKDGLASCSLGTSGVLFVQSRDLDVDPLGRLHAFCHAVPQRYHLMGVTLAAGGSLRWWRDVLGAVSYTELSRIAAAAPAGAEGLVFLPYLTGERSPHLDPRARGAFFGLTSRHTRSELTRAVMEGVVFSLRESLEVMEDLGVGPSEVRATGGGARDPFWRQLLADILGRPIVRMAIDEGPAYGVALLAGVACGVFPDVEEACVRAAAETGDRLEPNLALTALYEHNYAAFRDLYRQTASTMHALSDPPQS